MVLVVGTFDTDILNDPPFDKMCIWFHLGWMKPQKHIPLTMILLLDPWLPLFETGIPKMIKIWLSLVEFLVVPKIVQIDRACCGPIS